jgi:hypothetical protein
MITANEKVFMMKGEFGTQMLVTFACFCAKI